MTYILSQTTGTAVDRKTFGIWVDTEGNLSSVITRMKKGDRVEDIEKIVETIEPFILTRKEQEQIEKFRRFRSERYKRFQKEAN
ncbi:MAG: hypothetical protein JRN06_10600 [Nitrososphaerota archaeon]|nr:hypothetical protein [Nitrososphaerota archaeon]